LLDPKGKMLAKEQILTDSIGSVEPIAARAGAKLEELLSRHRLKRSQFEGCGIGVAGQQDPETGVIDDSPNLKWFGVQFKKPMEKALKLRIRMANDVNAAAGANMSTARSVNARTWRNLCRLRHRRRLCDHGKLVEGACGTAAEVGHAIFREDGIRCDCRRLGCHEAYAGGHPLEKRMRKLARQGKSPLIVKMVKGDLAKINTRTIADAAKKGDPVAKQLWYDATMSLCVLSANLVSLLNPNRLVLGGGVIEGNPSLLPAIRKFVNQRPWPWPLRVARLLPLNLKATPLRWEQQRWWRSKVERLKG